MSESFSTKLKGFLKDQKDLVAGYWFEDEEGGASRMDHVARVASEKILEPAQDNLSQFVTDRDLEKKTGKTFDTARSYWGPKILQQSGTARDFWKNSDSAAARIFQNGVSWASFGLGKYQDYSLGNMNKITEEQLQKYPESINNLLSFLLYMDTEAKDPQIKSRAREQFARVAPFAVNRVKQDNYEVRINESEVEGVVNAITSGTTVYATSDAVKALDDDETSAMFAHELGHASLNHNVPTLVQMLSSAAFYAGSVSVDALKWLFLGKESQLLSKVTQDGMISGLIQKISALDGQEVETEADEEGVRILVRAGIDPDNLKSAIVKLTLASEGIPAEEWSQYDMNNLKDRDENVRKYPDLKKRLDHIDWVIRKESPQLVASVTSN